MNGLRDFLVGLTIPFVVIFIFKERNNDHSILFSFFFIFWQKETYLLMFSSNNIVEFQLATNINPLSASVVLV